MNSDNMAAVEIGIIKKDTKKIKKYFTNVLREISEYRVKMILDGSVFHSLVKRVNKWIKMKL